MNLLDFKREGLVMDYIKKWIENNLDENDKLWNDIPEELIPLLQLLRAKLLENKKNIEELQNDLSNLDRRLSFYMQAINSLPNPIFIKDDKVQFVFLNDKYLEVFNTTRKEYLGKTVLDMKHLKEDDKQNYHKEDKKLLNNSSIVHYEASFIFSDGDVHDAFYWSKGFKVPSSGERGVVGEIVDISVEKNLEKELSRSLIKLKEMNEMIEKSSIIDPTTNLYNRYMINNKVYTFLEDAQKNMTDLCFLLADLDHFKSVNDIYGHIVGDEVLARFAEILKNTCQSEDVCIRFGGEEFLVVMPLTEIDTAECIAEKLCDNTREQLRLPNGDNITVSIGVTNYEFGETLSRFLTRVDKALYISKSQGKDRVTVL